MHPVIKVPRNVFLPQPNVDSAVLQFRFIGSVLWQMRSVFRDGEGMLCACAARPSSITLRPAAAERHGAAAMELLNRAGIDPGVAQRTAGAVDAFLICMRYMNMKVEANAKINLSLDVVRRRPDGYHDLRMIMMPLTLHDVLDVRRQKTGYPGRSDPNVPLR
ncbi:MAG: hypothetical protein V8T10_09705 [Merdibacter sp.]